MNVITIAGRIGKDAEIRMTGNGKAVASFSVADDQGRDKGTIWWNCQLWGERGEKLSQYLLKGSSVTVTGNVTEREYEGKKYYDVRVNDVALQGGKPSGGNEGYGQTDHRPAPAPVTRQQRAAPASSRFDPSEEIPF